LSLSAAKHALHFQQLALNPDDGLFTDGSVRVDLPLTTHFLLESNPEHPYSGIQPLPRSIKNRTEKFDKNITKRGAVPVKTRDNDELPVSKYLIAFFIVVVVGSSIVEILNLFSKTKDPDE
jgi:Ribosome associated membrane protein RAMP4